MACGLLPSNCSQELKNFVLSKAMNHQPLPTSSSDAEFHLRVRQAIVFAQTNARQFGLLFIQFPATSGDTLHPDKSDQRIRELAVHADSQFTA